MPLGIGIWELLVLLGVLLVFGPKKLPEMGRSLGRSVRELRAGITGDSEQIDPEAPETEQAR